ncbi:hypothetical protein D3C80_1530460 [compost metagenome]
MALWITKIPVFAADPALRNSHLLSWVVPVPAIVTTGLRLPPAEPVQSCTDRVKGCGATSWFGRSWDLAMTPKGSVLLSRLSVQVPLVSTAEKSSVTACTGADTAPLTASITASKVLR